MLYEDSLVATLSGPRFARDLCGAGVVFIYTWDGVKVTVGEVEIVEGCYTVGHEILLDDGSTLLVSRDTTVLLRSGLTSPIEHLIPETSLLALYTKQDSSGYTVYKEPGEWHKGAKTLRDAYRQRRVSRMVAEWKMRRRCEPGDVVSFKDGVRTNCHPNNLKIEHKAPRKPERKSKFAEPLFEAHRFIQESNHKVKSMMVDKGRNLFSIRGLEAANLAVNGIFISVDTE
jgi:hypothetical protein